MYRLIIPLFYTDNEDVRYAAIVLIQMCRGILLLSQIMSTLITIITLPYISTYLILSHLILSCPVSYHSALSIFDFHFTLFPVTLSYNFPWASQNIVPNLTAYFTSRQISSHANRSNDNPNNNKSNNEYQVIPQPLTVYDITSY